MPYHYDPDWKGGEHHPQGQDPGRDRCAARAAGRARARARRDVGHRLITAVITLCARLGGRTPRP